MRLSASNKHKLSLCHRFWTCHYIFFIPELCCFVCWNSLDSLAFMSRCKICAAFFVLDVADGCLEWDWFGSKKNDVAGCCQMLPGFTSRGEGLRAAKGDTSNDSCTKRENSPESRKDDKGKDVAHRKVKGWSCCMNWESLTVRVCVLQLWIRNWINYILCMCLGWSLQPPVTGKPDQRYT